VNHAAIDLGGKESQICIRRQDGTIIEERKVPTRKLTELVATWTASRVVMETSAEAFRIADAAIAAGHEVRVVPATLVRLLGVGDRGVKNDQRDAQHLSKASWQTDVPSVHIPSIVAHAAWINVRRSSIGPALVIPVRRSRSDTSFVRRTR
jgi:transposase